MSQCIFCRIVAGNIPATKLYEDDHVLAFMDIGPIVKGHALVIPKAHTETIGPTPDDTLAKVIAVTRRVARALQVGLGADGINIHQANGAAAGQVVPHIHFHVIPRFRHDGHHWNWSAQTYANPAEVAALADRIKAALD